MSTKVTASHLYAYTQCPHRVWRDAHDDQSMQDPESEFVKLLWEKGIQYEKTVIEKNKEDLELLDLSGLPNEKQKIETSAAINNKVPFIYHGRLEVDELIGEPDLLKLEDDGEYVPIDIKSGMGREGADESSEGKPKVHYALQLALYTDALRRLGHATHRKGYIWDSRGEIVEYNLAEPRGPKTPQTWWELYEETLLIVRAILEKNQKTESAMASACNYCHWRSTCRAQCIGRDDLTLVPELGVSKRDGFSGVVDTVKGLADLKLENVVDSDGKTGLPGMREKTLTKLIRRAKLQADKSKDPIVHTSFTLHEAPIELFFDIETDPTQDIVYLHGIVERRDGNDGERPFHAFLSEDVSMEAEAKAWREFWEYIRSIPKNERIIYYYSKYERTQYRSLAAKYSDIASLDDVEELFDEESGTAVDLYDIVKKHTDWPTYNYSVKTLAQHLGFKWRDKNPSGAASIEWYNSWCKTKDDSIMNRILEYNEDDCIAMIHLKDKLVEIAK